jgi:hypothetical protein
MLKGNTNKEDSGAVGDRRGRVRNAALVQDREVVFDGSGDDHDAPFTDWSALSDDTLNVTSDLSHMLGRYSLEFDKVNGAGNTKLAGVVSTSLKLDMSRFLWMDRVEAAFQVSSIADLVNIHVRLGTDASNYNQWTSQYIGTLAGEWNVLSMELKDCSVVGNGWDPTNVTYGAFVLEFSAETDTLADILLDSLLLRSRQPGEKAPDKVVAFAALDTPAQETPVVDARCCCTHTLQYSIANINSNVTLKAHGSLDGILWFLLDEWTVLSSQPQDGVREIDAFSASFLKFEFDAELGGVTAVITFLYRGGRG